MDSHDDDPEDVFYDAVADRAELLANDPIDTRLLPYALPTSWDTPHLPAIFGEAGPHRRDYLEEDIREWCSRSGFGISIRRSDTNKRNQSARVVYECDRNRSHHASESLGLRRTTTRRNVDCPFQFVIQRKAAPGDLAHGWTARIVNLRHENHPPSSSLIQHPMFRRRGLNKEQLDSLETHRIDRSVSARTMAHQHNTRHALDNPLTETDIYNIRQAGRRRDRDGLADTAAFVGKIRDGVERGVLWARFNWDDELKTDLLDVFWSYNVQGRACDLWGECITMDATYNVDEKQWPLVLGVVVTPEKSTYPVFMARLSDETARGYYWLAETIKMWRDGRLQPLVFITDGDQQLTDALDEYFPDVQRQRCVWHLNCNIITNIKKHWVKPTPGPLPRAKPHTAGQNSTQDGTQGTQGDNDGVTEDLQGVNNLHRKPQIDGRTRLKLGDVPQQVANTRAGFFRLWQHMVFSADKSEFYRARDLMRRQFADSQPTLWAYVSHQHLVRKEEWAGCYTRFYCNYGARTTSPNESTNGSIKSYGLSRKNGFTEVFQTTAQHIQQRAVGFKERQGKSLTRIRSQYIHHSWLQGVSFELSGWALDLLYEQYKIMQTFIPTLKNPAAVPTVCTGQFNAGMGLPCSHDMYQRWFEKEDIYVALDDCRKFWHHQIDVGILFVEPIAS